MISQKLTMIPGLGRTGFGRSNLPIYIYIYIFVCGYIPIQDNILKYYQCVFWSINQYDIYYGLPLAYPDARAKPRGKCARSLFFRYLHSRDGVDIAHGRPGKI